METSSGLPLIEVYCCRKWLVTPYLGWGRCGYCGEKPVKPETLIIRGKNE